MTTLDCCNFCKDFRWHGIIPRKEITTAHTITTKGNGDGINDIYKPKEGYQNIKEFHAYIYNRWGQKLFEWSDPATGWDGTYNGKPVKEGVYFCLVKAKGADGKTYEIKRDVNLLRGYTTEQYSNN